MGSGADRGSPPRARPTARPAGGGDRAGQIEEVLALGVVKEESGGQRLQDLGGGARQRAALQARVVVDAHAGEQGDLLPPQAGHAPARPDDGQPHHLRRHPGAAGGEELLDLRSRIRGGRCDGVGLAHGARLRAGTGSRQDPDRSSQALPPGRALSAPSAQRSSPTRGLTSDGDRHVRTPPRVPKSRGQEGMGERRASSRARPFP